MFVNWDGAKAWNSKPHCVENFVSFYSEPNLFGQFAGEILAKQVSPSKDDESIFKAFRGWSEKGTVYGLGNSSNLFYEKPIKNSNVNKSSYTPSVISQLQAKLYVL